jgi:hypothetical protein
MPPLTPTGKRDRAAEAELAAACRAVIDARERLAEASARAESLFTAVRLARGLTRLQACAEASLGGQGLTQWSLGGHLVMTDRTARALIDWLAREPTR